MLCVLDFLKQAGLARTMRCLEHETGLVVDEYGNDLMFLRALILDGQWRDAENFIKPLALQPHDQFDAPRVLFEIRRQRFLELVDGRDHEAATSALADGLKQLEGKCSKEEFNKLCYCLTLEQLSDHPDYADWTPFRGRLACFESIRHEFDRVLSQQWTEQRERAHKLNPNHLVALLHQAALYQASVYLAEGGGGRSLPNPMFFDLLSPAFQPLDAEGKNAGPRGRNTTSGNGGDVLSRDAMSRAQMELGFDRRSDGASVGGSKMYPKPYIKVLGSRMDKQNDFSAPSAVMRSSWAGPQSEAYDTNMSNAVGLRFTNQNDISNAQPNEHNFTRKKPVSWEVPIGINEHPVDITENEMLDEKQPPNDQGSDEAGGDANEVQEEVRDAGSERVGEVKSSDSKGVKKGPNKFEQTASLDSSSTKSQSVQHVPDEEPSQQPENTRKTYASINSHEEASSFVSFGEVVNKHAVRTVAFSLDGTRMAVGTNGRALQILACPSDDVAAKIIAGLTNENLDSDANRSSENKKNATHPSLEPTITLKPKVLTEFNNLHLGSVYDVSWSPDSSLLATCSNDMTVRVMKAPLAPNMPFDLQDRANRDAGDLPVATLRGHDGTVRSVCFTGDGHVVSGGAGDCLLRAWDPKRGGAGGALATLEGHTGAIFSVQSGEAGGSGAGRSGDGAGGFGPCTVVSGGEDRSIRIWDMRAGGKSVFSIGADPSRTHLEDGTPASAKSAVQSLSVCPTAMATVASGHEDGSCCVWDMRAGRLLWLLRAHESQCRSLDYDSTGRWILTASFDGSIGISDADVWERRVAAKFGGHSGKVLRAVWHPDACMFASSSADCTVKLWAPRPRKMN